jgi:hypothetical protein
MEINMTDATEIEAEATAGEGETLKVPVVKGKSFVEVNTAELPDHVYREALLQGLKVLVNRGQTTITKASYPEAQALQEKAMEVAQQTLENMYAGKIRIMGGAKADKVPREIMTEARRIARNLVKEELKRSGVKVSYVESSEITKAANALLAADPDIIKQAEEEVEKRAKKKVAIDVASIPISQKKVKAAEARKADKTLSAAKAGKVASRGRPGIQA